ncbi:hypothetical protein I3760_08G167100 [Carya illinoinensis]|nr:hypothetical protein I3760_08G167100 [Carya illinoinensis]
MAYIARRRRREHTASSKNQARPFPLSSLPSSQTAEPFVQNLRRPNPSFLDLFLSLRFENHRLPALFLSLRSAFWTESLSSAATHFSASNQVTLLCKLTAFQYQSSAATHTVLFSLSTHAHAFIVRINHLLQWKE